MIRTVVFDWFATLGVPQENDFWDRMEGLITEAGGRVDPEALAEWQEGPLDHRLHSASEETYRAWERQRLETLFCRCGLEGEVLARLCTTIEALRYNLPVLGLYPEVSDVLSRLQAQGLRVGLCSNWDWDLERHLAGNQLLERLDFVICSACVGYRKPHPAIFQLVLARAGVPSDEILFVGDNWDADMTGALAAGITPVHVARDRGCDRCTPAGVQCVSDLEEVVELVRAG